MVSVILLLQPLGVLTPNLTAQAVDIREFVRRTYIHGLPYEEASRYGPSVVPALLAMLDAPGEEPHWTNIVAVLGIVGDDRVVKPLQDFASEGVGELSHPQYRAKNSVPVALGYLGHKTGNREALDYLLASLDPNVWDGRGFAWASPYHPTTLERNEHLTEMAIIGLALSGRPRAGDALGSLQGGEVMGAAQRARFSTLVAEALSTYEIVSRFGLAEYYRRARVPR